MNSPPPRFLSTLYSRTHSISSDNLVGASLATRPASLGTPRDGRAAAGAAGVGVVNEDIGLALHVVLNDNEGSKLD